MRAFIFVMILDIYRVSITSVDIKNTNEPGKIDISETLN